MAFSKPRLQLFIVSVACMALIAGAVVYANNQSKREYVEKINVSQDSAPSQVSQIDASTSDEWKEQFINTKKASSTVTQGAVDEKQTLTDQFGKNFFVNFIALQQKDLLNDEDAIQSVVDNLIYSTALETPSEKTYSILELQLLPTNDQTAFRVYGNAVAQAFNTFAPRADVIDVVKNAFDRNDMGILVQIDSITSSYQKTIDALIEVPVPYEFSAYHLELINGLSRSKYVSEGLRQIETDPTLSLYSLNGYVSSREEIYKAFTGIKNLLIRNGIIYMPTEPGILFSTII